MTLTKRWTAASSDWPTWQHHILECALRVEITLPSGTDCGAAHRFVDAVFEAASRLFREPSVKGPLL